MEQGMMTLLHVTLGLLTILSLHNGSVMAVTSFIMPPLTPNGDEAGLIFIPGANIDGMAYKDTACAIQKASHLRLWVALTKNYILDTPNPAELSGAVKGAISALREAGMKGDNYVGVAHSLGGVFLGPYAKESPLKAVVLLGSYLTRGDSLKDYPHPVLTLSGELDGQTRITRIAVTFGELQIIAKQDPDALYTKPVLNIKGSSHAQFASGPMPSTVKNYDLEPEISIGQAHEAIGNYVSDFATGLFSENTSLVTQARNNLSKAHIDSRTRFQPLLDIKNMDQSESSSPWAIRMQMEVAGLSKDNIEISNNIDSYLEFVNSKPEVKKSGNGVLVSTTSYLTHPSNPLDISTIPESPQDMEVKMKSSNAIESVLGHKMEFSSLRNTTTCKDLNQFAIDIALKASTEDARRRYQTRGRQISLKDDIVYSTDIQWVPTGFSMTEDDHALTVQSVSLSSSLKSMFLPGMFYCKSLSPYRAMEWINVDSLRDHKP